MHAFRFTALLFCVAIAAQSAQAGQPKKPDPKKPGAPAAAPGTETATLPITGMM